MNRNKLPVTLTKKQLLHEFRYDKWFTVPVIIGESGVVRNHTHIGFVSVTKTGTDEYVVDKSSAYGQTVKD